VKLGVCARQDAGMRGQRDGALGIGILKKDARPRKGIDVRCLDPVVSVASKMIGSERIHGDQQYVCVLNLSFGTPLGQKAEEDEEESIPANKKSFHKNTPKTEKHPRS